jgi:adenine/guanine phosphoribosyltransferase-like PRPP-binding protein
MNDEDFWQRIDPSRAVAPGQTYGDRYPAILDDGRQLLLPIRTLSDGDHAVASLIINQASFAVVAALAAALADKLRPLVPEIIVGLPTLGLTLAAAVAQSLGHPRYIPLGTSRKFWYRAELSVPLSSITSPNTEKHLYIDPRMLPLLRGRRVALIDDVMSSGVSMAAGIALLARCDCTPVALGVAMLQSQRWRALLADVPPEQIAAVLRSPLFRRDASGSWRPLSEVGPAGA